MAPSNRQNNLSLSPNRSNRFSTVSLFRSGNPYRRSLSLRNSTSSGNPLRRYSSLSPKSSPPASPRKARSSTSTSIFNSIVNALKSKPKESKLLKKGSQSPIRPSGPPLSPIMNRHAQPHIHRIHYAPTTKQGESLSTRKSIRRGGTEKSGDEMEVDKGDPNTNRDDDGMGDILENGQHIHFPIVVEDPFATPPPFPPLSPALPLSPMRLDDGDEPEMSSSAGSSPDSARSRKRRARAAERSRLKTMQLLGSEARLAIRERYGDPVRPWEV
ncbi:hypothetical protein H0H93_010449 [Arthromyces matolae]|nr:hypothetical protein H0H93_010449 [Arthromyces matolae]